VTGPSDSAGTPWQARELSPSGFESDDGAADPALLAVLASPPDDATLVRAVRAARLVVPVVAAPTEVDTSGEHAVETSVEMAAVTLVAPDGRRALPVFSGVDALRAWDPRARPVPVTAPRAGQAAITEGCDVVVVDVAGPTTRVLRSSMVWAIALDREWVPAHTDPFVVRAVAVAAGGEPDARGSCGSCCTCGPGSAPTPCARWPPASASDWPPTGSCAPASTASRSPCAEHVAARPGRFRSAPRRW
jgi:hypothetical protein